MDTLRGEEREINHHGKKLNVGDENKDESEMTPVESIVRVSPADLKHRREDLEVEARKKFYEQIGRDQRNKDKLARCKRIGRVHIPIFIIAFVTVYWVFGLISMT